MRQVLLGYVTLNENVFLRNLTIAPDAKFGGTNLISCANVTDSNLDLCCDHSLDCCKTGVNRIRLDPNGLDAVTTIAPSASLATQLPISTSSIAPSSPSGASGTAAPTTQSTPETTSARSAASPSSSSASDKKSHQLSAGASAGIGVGCGAIAVLAINAAIFFWRRKRRQSRPGLSQMQNSGGSRGFNPIHEERGPEPKELSAERRPIELYNAKQPAWELGNHNNDRMSR